MISPGLPPWPRLWFDPERKRAMVTVRHPTWRSYEWAFWWSEVLVWIFNFALACVIWNSIPVEENAYRVMITLIAACICFPIASFATRLTFRDALARQIFATKTVLWVTPTAIIFKSRLFTRPVVIWRQWNDKPIKTGFIIQPDLDAANYLSDQQQQRKLPRGSINEAMLIEAVITTPGRHAISVSGGNETLQRSIPITEVCGRFAQRFSTVFTAALLLAIEDEEAPSENNSAGTDIDAS